MSNYEVWTEGTHSRIHLSTCGKRADGTAGMQLFRGGYGILIEAWADAARNGHRAIAACKVCIASAKHDAPRWDAAIMSMPSEHDFSPAEMIQQAVALGFATTRSGEHNHCDNRHKRGYLTKIGTRWKRAVVANAGDLAQEELESVSESEDFDSSTAFDNRERVLRPIVRRRGQPAFRAALIRAYQQTCAVTGCNAVDALEAAHIVPYNGPASNHIGNGLLLRADIHTLFDLHLISIHPDSMTVRLNERLHSTSYRDLDGVSVTQPTGGYSICDSLRKRWEP